jgi:hypothetical protein
VITTKKSFAGFAESAQSSPAAPAAAAGSFRGESDSVTHMHPLMPKVGKHQQLWSTAVMTWCSLICGFLAWHGMAVLLAHILLKFAATLLAPQFLQGRTWEE